MNSQPVYCSNGIMYKTVDSAARAFQLRPRDVLRSMLFNGPVKGHFFSREPGPLYRAAQEQRLEKYHAARERHAR